MKLCESIQDNEHARRAFALQQVHVGGLATPQLGVGVSSSVLKAGGRLQVPCVIPEFHALSRVHSHSLQYGDPCSREMAIWGLLLAALPPDARKVAAKPLVSQQDALLVPRSNRRSWIHCSDCTVLEAVIAIMMTSRTCEGSLLCNLGTSYTCHEDSRRFDVGPVSCG